MSEIDDLIYDAIDETETLAEVLKDTSMTLDDLRVWLADTAKTLAEIADEL